MANEKKQIDRCDNCKGKKKIMSWGMIMKECSKCNGIGFVNAKTTESTDNSTKYKKDRPIVPDLVNEGRKILKENDDDKNLRNLDKIVIPDTVKNDQERGARRGRPKKEKAA